MIKEFFKKHTHLKLSLQYGYFLGLGDGVWKIEIYNTTYASRLEPVFIYYIGDETMDTLLVDFETAIMTPIIDWWEECKLERKGRE